MNWPELLRPFSFFNEIIYPLHSLSFHLNTACIYITNAECKVFTKDNGVMPDLVPRTVSTIEPLFITDAGVLNLLLGLDAKKACGPDNIPNQFLKRYAQWCSRYLSCIFRKSLSTSQLPEDWKTATIIPIYKSGDKSNESNFRPISLTSTACKLLEHIILKHLTHFFWKRRYLVS